MYVYHMIRVILMSYFRAPNAKRVPGSAAPHGDIREEGTRKWRLGPCRDSESEAAQRTAIHGLSPQS